MPGLDPAKQLLIDTHVTPFLSGDVATVPPRCPVYDRCGGCHMQHIPYQQQLEGKRQMVLAALQSRRVYVDPALVTVHSLDDPWAYRTKLELVVRERSGQWRVGLNPVGARDVIEPASCAIVRPELDRAMRAYRCVLPEFPQLLPHLHSISLRASAMSGRIVATYFTRRSDPEAFASLTRRSSALCPEIQGGCTIRHGEAVGEGELILQERIGDHAFDLLPGMFFQVNPALAAVLAERVVALAQVTHVSRVLDLYAGAGLHTFALARVAGAVVAVEDCPAAVAAARARAASLPGCRFLQARVEAVVEELLRARPRPDVIVVNPPRPGCGPAVLAAINGSAVPRLLYVSCNPASLGRDAEELIAHGWTLDALEVLDLFPQTRHVEALARFVRTSD